MNYIYDVVLNFNKHYYEFFEWKKTDKIMNVKKIPAFKVSCDDLRDLKFNEIKLNKKFIDKIFQLTLFYNKKDNYDYMCLVSSCNEAIGLMFDKEGNIIKRSSLVFDEEEEVNEEVYNNDLIELDYEKNIYKKQENISRIDREKKEILLKFLNSLNEEKDCSILKYIYYDYFEKEEDDIKKIRKEILKELNSNSNNMNKLYELVKVLKKIKN